MSESESAVARAVLTHGPLSRRDLAARLDLSPASLTRLAKPLLERGLLIELDEVDESGWEGRAFIHPDDDDDDDELEFVVGIYPAGSVDPLPESTPSS